MSKDRVSIPSRRDIITTAALVGAASAVGGSSQVLAQSQGTTSPSSEKSFRLFDPEGLPPSNGFSQVVEVTGGKLVYISGQVPRNGAGDLVGEGDFRKQLEQVFANLDIAVRAVGGTFANVIKLNYYCVASIEPAQQRAVVEVRDRYVNTKAPPASTFVFVSRLVRPEWLIEIEAIASLPATVSTRVAGLARPDFPEPAVE